MRKVLSLAVAAMFLSVAATSAFAFTSVTKSTKTAKVQFTGAGAFTWSVEVKNVSDNLVGTDITWNTSTVTPGVTKWATAQQYAHIKSSMTASNYGLQVYTDNTNASSAFRYTGGQTQNLGGLVAQGAANSAANPLPMGWSVMRSTQSASYVVNPTSPTFAGLYFKDRGNSTASDGNTPFADGEDYITVLNKSGLKYGGNANERGGSPSGDFYMYIGADFSAAMTPMTYGTDTLTFEAYTE